MCFVASPVHQLNIPVAMERCQFKTKFAETVTPYLWRLVEVYVSRSDSPQPRFQDVYDAVVSSLPSDDPICGEWALAELSGFLDGDEVRVAIRHRAAILQECRRTPDMRWFQELHSCLCDLSNCLASVFMHPVGLTVGGGCTWTKVVGAPLWRHLRAAFDSHRIEAERSTQTSPSGKVTDLQLILFAIGSYAFSPTVVIPESLLPLSQFQEQELPAWWCGSASAGSDDAEEHLLSTFVKLRYEVPATFRVPTNPPDEVLNSIP